MICLICRQAEILDGLTSVQFQRGEMRLTVNNVPAQICPGCAEAYVEEDVAVQLLRQAEIFSDDGVLEANTEYGKVGGPHVS
ncbi:MAG TPA: YgiT-type zinc finger protein [Nitrospira sp.]|nr:YgiT-type zinc finger protein [Nitrospira sp.]